jgi:hypothetical protein
MQKAADRLFTRFRGQNQVGIFCSKDPNHLADVAGCDPNQNIAKACLLLESQTTLASWPACRQVKPHRRRSKTCTFALQHAAVDVKSSDILDEIKCVHVACLKIHPMNVLLARIKTMRPTLDQIDTMVHVTCRRLQRRTSHTQFAAQIFSVDSFYPARRKPPSLHALSRHEGSDAFIVHSCEFSVTHDDT